MSFLKAEWRKLAIANYEVNPALLKPYLPYGTELDLWNGKCYVSLIGFMFLNTQILNIKVPFHINFEEVNLRFYVKRLEQNEWKRGVVFVKEIVPRLAISLIANTVYNENYEALPMRHNWTETGTDRLVEYSWRKSGTWYSFSIRAAKEATAIAPGSETEFITEHYWGYARSSAAKTNEYEVTHPRWLAYEVLNYKIDVDFGKVYGSKFSFLSSRTPDSVMLAEGSAITVEPKKRIVKQAAAKAVAP